MLLGCAIVTLGAAVATALLVNHEVSTLRTNLSINPKIALAKGTLAPAGWGAPETLLLVGNDQRNHTTTAPVLPHANEMLLVRIDPSKPWISMMSLPRELSVPIHTPSSGVVTTRLNASLMFGGIPLLISTVKQVTGLSVNHVIEIDFNNFKRAVDELGCVYSTVDRRYLHVNTPTSQQYQQIDLQPGYQRLCGDAALSFVSYRHGDTSQIRDVRDQDFLVAAKQELGPGLVDHLHEFERIFGQTVQTDAGLHTSSGLLNLLGTMISEAGKPVRQVTFQDTELATVDTATPGQVKASVHSFLHGADHVPRRGVVASARAIHRHHTSGAALMRTPASELSLMRPRARALSFALEYPRLRAAAAAGGPAQAVGCSGVAEPIVCLREYRISVRHQRDGRSAYVVVTAEGGLGQYYDVQGSTWTTAPMFDHPTQVIHVGGRAYAMYYSGAHLDVVAWWQHGAVYWVHNTLTDALTNRAMLAIAESTTPLGRSSVPVDARAPRASGASTVPVPVASGARSTVLQTVGRIGGLVSLPILLALGAATVVRHRRLRRLRRALDETRWRAASLRAANEPLRAPAGDAGVRMAGPSVAAPAPAVTHPRLDGSRT